MILFKNPFKKEISIQERVQIIKNGDSNERERLIKDYKPFIINIVSKEIGKFVSDGDCDELSIGLMAFNEALDKFDMDVSNSFFTFAEKVIKSRLIDFYRKEKKNLNTIPISYLNEFYEDEEIEEKLFVDHSHANKQDVWEEIEDFTKSLKLFEITIEDLIENSPKHVDARRNAAKIAFQIANDEMLMKKIMDSKKMPTTEIEKIYCISRKVLHKNKKFIIAVCIILMSNNDIMKSYVNNLLEEVN